MGPCLPRIFRTAHPHGQDLALVRARVVSDRIPLTPPGREHDETPIAHASGGYVHAIRRWLMWCRYTTTCPESAIGAARPTLDVTFPATVSRLIEDCRDDVPAGHRCEIRPRTDVVDCDIPFHATLPFVREFRDHTDMKRIFYAPFSQSVGWIPPPNRVADPFPRFRFCGYISFPAMKIPTFESFSVERSNS